MSAVSLRITRVEGACESAPDTVFLLVLFRRIVMQSSLRPCSCVSLCSGDSCTAVLVQYRLGTCVACVDHIDVFKFGIKSAIAFRADWTQQSHILIYFSCGGREQQLPHHACVFFALYGLSHGTELSSSHTLGMYTSGAASVCTCKLLVSASSKTC